MFTQAEELELRLAAEARMAPERSVSWAVRRLRPNLRRALALRVDLDLVFAPLAAQGILLFRPGEARLGPELEAHLAGRLRQILTLLVSGQLVPLLTNIRKNGQYLWFADKPTILDSEFRLLRTLRLEAPAAPPGRWKVLHAVSAYGAPIARLLQKLNIQDDPTADLVAEAYREGKVQALQQVPEAIAGDAAAAG